MTAYEKWVTAVQQGNLEAFSQLVAQFHSNSNYVISGRGRRGGSTTWANELSANPPILPSDSRKRGEMVYGNSDNS